MLWQGRDFGILGTFQKFDILMAKMKLAPGNSTPLITREQSTDNIHPHSLLSFLFPVWGLKVWRRVEEDPTKQPNVGYFRAGPIPWSEGVDASPSPQLGHMCPAVSSTGLQGENSKTNYQEPRGLGLAPWGCRGRHEALLEGRTPGTKSRGCRNQEMEGAGEAAVTQFSCVGTSAEPRRVGTVVGATVAAQACCTKELYSARLPFCRSER